MYTVFFYNPSSPIELKAWLDKLYKQDELTLIAVDNGYYIFKNALYVSFAPCDAGESERSVLPFDISSNDAIAVS